LLFSFLAHFLLTVTHSSLPDLIRAIEQADAPASLIGAVRALAAVRAVESIPTLIQVLGFNNPGAAIAAVDGLVQLGEVAVPPLLTQIDGYNYGARAYAIRALAAIADPRSLEVLLSAAATDFAPSVRRAATKGLGYLQWSCLPAAQIAEAQTQALQTLLTVSQDLDWAIRYAAVVGLQALAEAIATQETDAFRAAICDRLETMTQTDPDAATQARAKFALQQVQAVLSPPVAVNR
jgi:phycocyanobilin lyase beta subunit